MCVTKPLFLWQAAAKLAAKEAVLAAMAPRKTPGKTPGRKPKKEEEIVLPEVELPDNPELYKVNTLLKLT